MTDQERSAIIESLIQKLGDINQIICQVRTGQCKTASENLKKQAGSFGYLAFDLLNKAGLRPLDDTRDRMQDMGRAVSERIPADWGFFLFVFPFGQPDGRRSNYISNAKRVDVVKMIKEWMLRGGAEEEWMEHIQ